MSKKSNNARPRSQTTLTDFDNWEPVLPDDDEPILLTDLGVPSDDKDKYVLKTTLEDFKKEDDKSMPTNEERKESWDNWAPLTVPPINQGQFTYDRWTDENQHIYDTDIYAVFDNLDKEKLDFSSLASFESLFYKWFNSVKDDPEKKADCIKFITENFLQSEPEMAEAYFNLLLDVGPLPTSESKSTMESTSNSENTGSNPKKDPTKEDFTDQLLNSITSINFQEEQFYPSEVDLTVEIEKENGETIKHRLMIDYGEEAKDMETQRGDLLDIALKADF